MIRGIDPADEVFVAGEDHDKNEIGGEREVHQIEHAGDDVMPWHAPRLNHEIIEIAEEAVDQQQQTDQQTEQERRQQPAAEKDRGLNVASVRPRHEKAPDCPVGLPYAANSEWHLLHVATRRSLFANLSSHSGTDGATHAGAAKTAIAVRVLREVLL